MAALPMTRLTLPPGEGNEALAHLQFVHRAMALTSWVWDIAGDRVQWFGEPHRLLGVDAASFGGRFAEYLQRMHPEDAPAARRTFIECLKGARTSYRSVERVVCPRGGVRWLEVVGHTEYSADGRAVRMAGVLRDVTERCDAEHRIRELDAFSVSVSHDLLAPIRNICSFARYLLEEGQHLLGGQLQSMVGHIDRCAQRMDAMVRGLLDLSRAGREALDLGTVDVARLAHELGEELRGTYGFAGELRVAPLHRCRADARLAAQVLQNLIGNAMKFSRDADSPRVEISSRALEQGWVEYRVSDNGCGFPAGQAGRLFQAFQRLHGAAQFEGSGVGLATVRRIVERHGGEVRAEGASGQGASFYFTLPGAS